MSRLEQALIAVAQFLERHQVPYMVIGGIANIMWGIPRTTLDVDLTVSVSERQLDAVIESLVRVFPPRISDPIAFVKKTQVLPLRTSHGVSVDVIFGQLPYEEQAIHTSRERAGPRGRDSRVPAGRPDHSQARLRATERPG